MSDSHRPMDHAATGNSDKMMIDSPSEVRALGTKWLQEFLADLSQDWAERMCRDDDDDAE